MEPLHDRGLSNATHLIFLSLKITSAQFPLRELIFSLGFEVVIRRMRILTILAPFSLFYQECFRLQMFVLFHSGLQPWNFHSWNFHSRNSCFLAIFFPSIFIHEIFLSWNFRVMEKVFMELSFMKYSIMEFSFMKFSIHAIFIPEIFSRAIFNIGIFLQCLPAQGHGFAILIQI